MLFKGLVELGHILYIQTCNVLNCALFSISIRLTCDLNEGTAMVS